MPKRILSILMLYSALAIMLGHNFIPHHHPDFGHSEVLPHHHHEHPCDNDTEDESDDWGHLFSGLFHGEGGLTFLNSPNSGENFSQHISLFTPLYASNFIFNQVNIEARQNAPPYSANCLYSIEYIPYGLRAPPVSIA